MYQLKKGKEAFTVVEGPLKGRTFAPGKSYSEIPPGEGAKFTEIKASAPAGEDAKPAKAESKKAISQPGTDLKSVPADKEVKS